MLRGPQGTRYGANALAGPDQDQDARRDAEPGCCTRRSPAASDDTWSAGVAAGGGPIGERRLGVARGGADVLERRLPAQRLPRSRRHQRARRDDAARQAAAGSWRRAGAPISPRCTSISTTASTPSRPTIRARTLSDKPGRDAQRTRGVSAERRGHGRATTRCAASAPTRSPTSSTASTATGATTRTGASSRRTTTSRATSASARR